MRGKGWVWQPVAKEAYTSAAPDVCHMRDFQPFNTKQKEKKIATPQVFSTSDCEYGGGCMHATLFAAEPLLVVSVMVTLVTLATCG